MSQYMYRHLTCRLWKSYPAGCFDGPIRCRYSHVDTGIMSPPLNVTCWLWKIGRCTLHENDCPFVHMDTGPLQSSPVYPTPALRGRNAAIAKAAAAAGFDVTDTTSFVDLIHTIRDADRAIYPDYYRGSGRYISDIYPDHWIAADMYQQPGTTGHRDLGKIPSVPALNASAQRMVREQHDGDALSCPARQIVTGANGETLGARTSNKRTADDFTPQPASKIRRVKDCHQQIVRATTSVSFQKVLQKLKLGGVSLEKDRSILRKRWELDMDLQVQTVTDDLQSLNACLLTAENAIREAAAVIEERFLGLPASVAPI